MPAGFAHAGRMMGVWDGMGWDRGTVAAVPVVCRRARKDGSIPWHDISVNAIDRQDARHQTPDTSSTVALPALRLVVPT